MKKSKYSINEGLSHNEIISKEKDFILEQGKKNKFKIKLHDGINLFCTWFFSSFTVITVIAIFVFVFNKGWNNLSWDLLSGDYSSETYLFKTNENYENTNEINSFSYTCGEDEYFSSRWGIAFKDSNDVVNNSIVTVSYVNPSSPFNTNIVNNEGNNAPIKKGDIISSMIVYIEDNGKLSKVPLSPTSIKKPNDETPAMFYAETFESTIYIKSGYITTGGNGIRGSFIATLLTIVFTLLFAIPLGIGAAIYLALYAKKNKLTRIISATIDLLAGIPSIIYGLMGALIFIPLCSLGGNTGSILSGSLTLAVMVLPIIVKNTEEAIKILPNSLQQGSLALGASKAQTIFKVIIPNAMSGILTGTILATGRIIGESASLIYAVGAVIQDDISILKPATTLSVHIWTIMQGESPNYTAACSISIIILFMVLILNLILTLVSKYFNRYSNTSKNVIYVYWKKLQEKFKKKEVNNA